MCPVTEEGGYCAPPPFVLECISQSAWGLGVILAPLLFVFRRYLATFLRVHTSTCADREGAFFCVFPNTFGKVVCERVCVQARRVRLCSLFQQKTLDKMLGCEGKEGEACRRFPATSRQGACFHPCADSGTR